MPWNGSGVTNRVHNWVNDRDAAIDITASRIDADSDDIVTMIQACVAKNGENSATANLPMGTFKHTGVGASSTLTDYVRVTELMNGTHRYGAAGGSADAQTLTPTPSIAAYASGQAFEFAPVANNTGPCTLNVSGKGVRSIKLSDGTDPAAGDLSASGVARVVFYGTNFFLLNPATFTANGAAIWSNKALISSVLESPAISGTITGQSYTGTYATPASGGTHTTTLTHGLGTDDLDVSIMLDFTNITGTDEANIVAHAINANGEGNHAGRSLGVGPTSADIPAAGKIEVIVTHNLSKAITVRVVVRKR